MSNYSVSVNYQNQVGQVYFGGDFSESDMWIAKETNHVGGSSTWQLVDHDGKVHFERNVFNTPEWIEQVKIDLLEAAKAVNPTAVIEYNDDFVNYEEEND